MIQKWTWGRVKKLLLDRSFFPSATCHGIATGGAGTPPLFAKPFLGIYLFALQKDKCLSSFIKQRFNIVFFNHLLLVRI